ARSRRSWSRGRRACAPSRSPRNASNAERCHVASLFDTPNAYEQVASRSHASQKAVQQWANPARASAMPEFPERIVLALTVAHGRRCEGGDLTLLLQPGPTLYKAIKLR